MASTRLGQKQDARNVIHVSQVGKKGPDTCKLIHCFSQAISKGARFKMEQLGFEPASVWFFSVTGKHFKLLCCNTGPWCLYLALITTPLRTPEFHIKDPGFEFHLWSWFQLPANMCLEGIRRSLNYNVPCYPHKGTQSVLQALVLLRLLLPFGEWPAEGRSLSESLSSWLSNKIIIKN